jgi:hypothetical protein
MNRPNWAYQASIYLPRAHCMVYRDDALGIQLQILTRHRAFWTAGGIQEYYFADGMDGMFRDEQSLLEALEKRVSKTEKRGNGNHAWKRLSFAAQMT